MLYNFWKLAVLRKDCAMFSMWFVYLLAVSFLAAHREAYQYHKHPSHLLNRPIVGGDGAEVSNFPYQVSLGLVKGHDEGNLTTRHFCGGSIISVEWVLSAAHCLTFLDSPRETVVRVGSSVNDQGGYLHKVTQLVIHSDYVKSNHPDIGLLKVATPFEIGPNVKPIPLSNIPLQTGRIAIVSGWGVTTEDGTRTPNLQKVAIPVLPQWECKLVSRDKIIDGMFCAGRAGRSACYGDSGGPVVVDGYQIGIVSGGYSCELPGVPGFYVNVYELRNWIYENCGV